MHFLILSLLSGFLWYAINWFVHELEAANQNEQEIRKAREPWTAQKDDNHEQDSGEETEGVDEGKKKGEIRNSKEAGSNSLLSSYQGDLRKRRSVGEHSSGDLSTDSEWDKVGDSEGDISGRSSQE